MKRAVAFLFAIFLSANIFCQEDIIYSNNGRAYFQNQDYYLLIFLVNDLKQAVDNWNIPNATPSFNSTTTVKMNEPISLFIVYAANKDSINLNYNLRLIEPDGTFSENINYEGLKISDTVRTKQTMYLGAQLPTIRFDEEETGTYSFVVEAYDDNELIRKFMLEFSLL